VHFRFYIYQNPVWMLEGCQLLRVALSRQSESLDFQNGLPAGQEILPQCAAVCI